MLPIFVDEATGCPFVYYQHGVLYTGLTLHNRFYKLAGQSSLRHHAFDLARDLAGRNIATVVTRSQSLYRVWVDLRAGTQCIGQPLFADILMPSEQSRAVAEVPEGATQETLDAEPNLVKMPLNQSPAENNRPSWGTMRPLESGV